MAFFSSAIDTLRGVVVVVGGGSAQADNFWGGGLIFTPPPLSFLCCFFWFLTDWLTNWLKELLIGGIMGNLEGLFDTVNAQVGEIAAQVGTTPAAWHAGVFSLIRQLSETVILPIAGMVLTFVATYELIQMLLEKNNMHEVDVANLYKWMFKTACAILILSNTFNIVMAVFDVSQSVIAQAGGLIQGSTDVSADMLAELETSLEAMDLGPLLGLWLQSALIGFTMKAMGIIIFVLVYGRMLEIYLLTSLAHCFLLYAVQNGQYLPAHFRRALEGGAYGRTFNLGTKCPEVPGFPGGAVPYGRHRGPALPAPTLGGYALDRSALWHDPQLLGCAPLPLRSFGRRCAGRSSRRVRCCSLLNAPMTRCWGPPTSPCSAMSGYGTRAGVLAFLNASRAPLKKDGEYSGVLSKLPLQSAVRAGQALQENR